MVKGRIARPSQREPVTKACGARNAEAVRVRVWARAWGWVWVEGLRGVEEGRGDDVHGEQEMEEQARALGQRLVEAARLAVDLAQRELLHPRPQQQRSCSRGRRAAQ